MLLVLQCSVRFLVLLALSPLLVTSPTLLAFRQKAWLHFRNLILSILAAAVLSVKELRRSNTGDRDSPSHGCLVNGSSDTDVSMVTVVKDLLSRFTKHAEQCVKDFSVAMKVT